MVRKRLERKTNLVFALGWDMWSDHHHRERSELLNVIRLPLDIMQAGISRIANGEKHYVNEWYACAHVNLNENAISYCF